MSFITGLLALICLVFFGGIFFEEKTIRLLELAWAGLKLVVAVLLSPLLWVTFKLSPNRVFLAVFTFLWPHNDIQKVGKGLYLRRFYLTPRIKGRKRYFLHYIARSDDDRDGHDHPWDFDSEILFNGYVEQVFFPRDQVFRNQHEGSACEIRVRRQGDKFSNLATHTHKVTLLTVNGVQQGTWTLVKRSWRGRTWGFWEIDPLDASKDNWVPNDKYDGRGNYKSSWGASSGLSLPAD